MHLLTPHPHTINTHTHGQNADDSGATQFGVAMVGHYCYYTRNVHCDTDNCVLLRSLGRRSPASVEQRTILKDRHGACVFACVCSRACIPLLLALSSFNPRIAHSLLPGLLFTYMCLHVFIPLSCSVRLFTNIHPHEPYAQRSISHT